MSNNMSNTNASNLNINKIVPVRGATKRFKKVSKKDKIKLPKIVKESLHDKEQSLFLFCYQNEIHFDQYNKYHFRLFLNGNMLDVWPTSKKFWGRRMSASKVYKDPNELLEYLQ